MHGRTKLLLLAFLLAACGGSPNGNGNGDGGVPPINASSIVVTPDPVTLDLNAGGPAVTQTFTATAMTPSGNQDVSLSSIWTIDDTGLGSMDLNLFTSGTTRGGSTLVHAAYQSANNGILQGQAHLNIKFHASVVVSCPGCPPFPGPGTPPCAAGGTPTISYPPDQVLLPPNMNVIETQYKGGTGNTLFQISFQNAITDVNVVTRCNPFTNNRNLTNAGCAYSLDPTVWNYVANGNRGGDPVVVTVRGAPDNGSCVGTSTSVNLNFAEEDINGGIYYWQSVTSGGVAGKTGGIFRHDFGDPTAAAQGVLVPGSTLAGNACVGCHSLSRDGKRLTFGSDDADSDDEYSDLNVRLYHIDDNTVQTSSGPGFTAFSPDHTRVLLSDGLQRRSLMHMFNGDTQAAMADITLPFFGTHPDWTKAGDFVYFVRPGSIYTWTNTFCSTQSEDDHFSGGSIYKMSVNGTTFGTPTVVVQSAGVNENNYYPSVSPNGKFLLWDRATGTTLAGRDSFNNPTAAMFASANGGPAVEMAKANRGANLTNSWPRWSPFVQNYKGHPILWATFSSTRDYGLRIHNESVPAGAPENGPLVNCYPPDTPEFDCSAACPGAPNCHGTAFAGNCNAPQIWMTAVTLDDLEFQSQDPSHPAFWLPFQDITSHNHIAQWTEKVVGPPPGQCAMQGESCTATPCCTGLVCNTITGVCDIAVP